MGFRVRSIRASGWFWLRREILTEYGPIIGVYGIAVYNALAMCADNDSQESFPGVEYIAKMIGCSTRQVQKMIRLLENQGLIAVEQETTESGAYWHNVYWLLDVSKPQPVDDAESKTTTGCMVNQVHHMVNQVHQDGAPGASKLDSSNYIWQKSLAELEMVFARGAFSRWLAGSTASQNGDGSLRIRVRDPYAVAWLSERWQEKIEETVSSIAGEPTTVKFHAKK